ncbi:MULTISPECIES: ABC transporter substrate-binding protein [unclassified Halorubrum]|uniref:ABC transporter substrate-binding protein n=1 Tax=unclassified Halorubrum TaxID=2642239 RepID=UPI000B995FA7|nr:MULTISPECIES: ABC transporter substrate-binding protein [unclassified Halorubrum]OYR40895.1 peptide ABC transporter substrate-binding protein [Halorubrum sp. Hd13]OYR44279.1 peptide ABC transporter substrate-binding protein [Halorubrum sp. Eb13]OYR49469.1 peptide ABC transporter substrate-binding protein [Halorubrum sp. Ea8]
MRSDNDDRINRRTMLTYAGTAAAVGLAGCSGNGGDGSDGSDGSDGDDGTDGSDGSDGSDGDDGGDEAFELGVTMGQMDSGLDPQDHAETNTEIIVGQVYEGLLDRDKEGGIIEGLATDWERTEDGSVRFVLRDTSFHNGDPVTSEDVRFSIRRIVDDDVGIASPQKNDLGSVSEVVAGDGEVTVSFEGFNPIAFQLFATNGEIVQQSWIEENDGNFINRNTNGTGPFVVTEYDSGNEVAYEPNDDYWGGDVPVDALTMSASSESSTRVNRLLAEETDIVTNVPPQEVSRVESSDVAGINSVPSARIIFLQMRYDVEPFSSQQFRQAMNHAVDVESIIENVLNGFGNITGQPTLEGHVGHNPDIEPYPYDPEEAERLVDESGHAGVEITLQTPIGRYLGDVEIAQAAANQIDSLSNVSCSLEQREFSSLVQDITTGNIEDKPHFNLLGWGNGEFDGSQTITPLMTTEGALTILENEELDQLMVDAESTEDPDERVEILQEANQLAHDLAPWVFLHQQFSVYGVSSDISWEPRADEFIDPDTATQQ